MPFSIDRYASSLAALESLDSNLALLTSADDTIAQKFKALDSATRRAATLMREYGAEFTRLLDVSRSDRPEIAIPETEEWMKTLVGVTASAQQRSDDCRAKLAQALSNIQSLDLPSVFYLDQEGVEQSLSTLQTFAHETRVLSPASLTSIQQQVASGLIEHGRTHVSRLLVGARDEAMAFLSQLDANQSGFQLVNQFATAVNAVNTDVRNSFERLQLQIEQIQTSAEFNAIVHPEVDGVMPSLQDVDASKIREADIDIATSGMLHVVCTSIMQRLSALRSASDLMGVVPHTVAELEIAMVVPNSLDEIPAALQSLVSLVDVYARSVAALMRESGQATDALLAQNYFIGREAYALKQKLREQDELVRGLLQRWPELYATVPFKRVKALLSGISDISPLIGVVLQNTALFASELERLRPSSPAYDIASVIVLQDGSPVGLRSLVQDAGNRWVFSPETSGTMRDSQRTLCISFSTGVVPRREIRIRLAPESVLGDWIRWISGGFMLRARPATGPQWPSPSTSLQAFLKIHVFQQWAGKTRLQDLIDQVNLAMHQRPQECETYLSRVEV